MRRFILFIISLTFIVLHSSAQSADTTVVIEQKSYIPHAGELEFFSGIELNYRDIFFKSQYDFLIRLTPGIKWHPWKHTVVSAQAYIPIVNQYGDYYKTPSLNNLTISQELLLFRHLAVKPTVGVFSNERWGVDVKAAYPLNPWLSFSAEMGWTGYVRLVERWDVSPLSRILLLGGANIFLNKLQTEFRLYGGRFLNDDMGAVVEAMRHFTHCTIGMYGSYSDNGIKEHGINAGFKVVVAIPPYKRTHRSVRFRPASNFMLTNNFNADVRANRIYMTDPEQNERHGWFSEDIFPWGQHQYNDFVEK